MSEKHKKESAESSAKEELFKEQDAESELPEAEEPQAQADGAEEPADGQAPEEQPSEPSELEKAQALAEDYKRKWYSVSAEYDNYRKRTAMQSAQSYEAGKADAVLKLLPVADTFGYALDSAKDEATKAGIDKIIKNFVNILAALGVEEIPLKEGDAFDESVAEAVMNVPCGEGEQPNAVKLVLKKGYRQNGKVIRFAQVSVTV